MRCFVTGATGVLGAHLVRALLDRGWPVAALVRPSSERQRVADCLPRVTTIESDTIGSRAIAEPLREFAPEVCFHLAWWGVDSALRDEPRQISENFDGGVALFDTAIGAGCTQWIGLGTLDEYGALEGVLAEDTPRVPARLYGAVKIALCEVTRQLAAQSGVSWCWLRCAPTYGPFDSPTRLVPTVIRTLLRGEKPLLTAGEQKWDYLYLADAADALCRAAERRLDGDFNVGSGTVAPVRTIAEMVRDRIDPRLPLGLGELPYRPNQPMHIQADSGRFCAATAWSPRTSLEEGIRETIAWERAQLDGVIR